MTNKEKSKILIVDDLPANTTAMEAILKPLGVDIIKAHSGDEALGMLLRHNFAVVVLDVQMPIMDGFETAKLIRNSKNNEFTPIIFVTAIDRDQDRIAEGYGSGAVDFLFKPVDPIQLISKIKIFLELDEQKNELQVLAEKEKKLRILRDQQNKRLRLQSKLWLMIVALMIICTGFMFYNFQISKNNVHLKEVNEQISELNRSYGRFVPHEFVALLGKDDIKDVKLGDQVLQAMTVMFFDMAGFTSISEQMSAKEIITLMNEIFSIVQPIIEKNKGIINKYLGDGAMVIFPDSENDAVIAAIEIMSAIDNLNNKRTEAGLKSLSIGIGIDSGPLILGTVGDENRLEHTVYGNTVNLASRVEGLTRKYGVNMLVTENVYSRLNPGSRQNIRVVDNVRVKGKSGIITIYDVYVGNDELVAKRHKTLDDYIEGFHFYQKGNFKEAVENFKKILEVDPDDNLVKYHLLKCEDLMKSDLKNWSPVENFLTK